MAERVLVTSALPYANGPAHVGHLVEYLQTDIWVRYLKLAGRDAIYVCASDTHGTPIELNAAKAGVAPEAFVARWHEEQKRDFADFLVEFDVFHTTHSEENRRWAAEIYERAKRKGHIVEKPLEQWYCVTDARFLPDRFVKGTCPSCGAADQYGDVCEVCKKVYAPTELKEPYCAICRKPPERRTSNHLFFKLGDFQPFLEKLVAREGFLHPSVRNWVKGWLDGGLEDWCVSRDGPYFGFPIPGAEGKFFYVWLDAPIGYLSSTVKLLGEEQALKRYWSADAGARIVHFIGKDIVYFHTLFWPAMLHAAGLAVPDRVQVHGMLTLGGEKISKSRSGKSLVTARQLLDAGIDPEALRWFYASNLTSAANDVPLSGEEIKNRVNAELVKTLANFVSRALTPLKKDLAGTLSAPLDDEASRALWAKALETHRKVRAAYEAFELRDATQALLLLGFEANKFVQDRAPWTKRKQGDEAGARADLTLAANVAWVLGTWLAPILPRSAKRLEAMLGGPKLDPARLDGGGYPLPAGTTLGEVSHLAQPIDDAALEKLWPESPDAAPAAKPAPAKPEKAAKEAKPAEAPPGIIGYEDFARVELKVGRILEAAKVEGADKLLRLTVDLAEPAGPRTIVAGIAQHYAPEALPGKQVVVVANLAPKKLRGIESHGMLLAAGGDAGKLVLAEVPDAPVGSRVK